MRLLIAELEMFRAEDEAALKAGLGGADATVDDTGARNAGKSGYNTQIGSDTFTAFGIGPSKSRLAFCCACGGTYALCDQRRGARRYEILPAP